MKFLHFNFLPRSADIALLALRLWYGLAMLLLHGWGKLANWSSMAEQFPNLFGIGKTTNLALAIFGELVCTALIVLGLFTRAAALVAGITMFVAFWIVHQHQFAGPNSGEMAFTYLGVFIALFVAGGGKYSLDAKLGAKG